MVAQVGFQPSEMAKTTASESCLSNQTICSVSLDFSESHDTDLLFKKKRKSLTIGFCKLPIFWANFFFASVVLTAEVGQNVTLPLWLDSANRNGTASPRIGSYFIMSFSCLTFSIAFGFGIVLIKIFSPNDLGEAEKNFPHLLLFLIGLSDAVNGVMVAYAGRGSRTPPYLQAILGNFLIPLTILFRMLMLRKKPTILKLLCGLAVFLGLFICLIPTIFPSVNSEANLEANIHVDAVSRVMWPIIFMLGSLPEATMNVLQERGVKMENKTSEEQINLVYFLFWTSTYEFLCVALFFWVDILPWYGDSENLAKLATNWWTGLQCFFGQAGCGSAPGFRGTINILAHVFAHVGAANLLRHAEGATWLAIVMSLVTPLGFIFWTLFKESPFEWHPEGHVSTWFSIGALAIMVPAVLIYNMGDPEISENVDGIRRQRSGKYYRVNSFAKPENSPSNPEAESLLLDTDRQINYNSFEMILTQHKADN